MHNTPAPPQQLVASAANKEKAIKVYLHMKQILEEIRKSDRLAMQIFTHPEATANQIMSVRETIVETRNWYRKEHSRLAHILGKCLPYNTSWDTLKLPY